MKCPEGYCTLLQWLDADGNLKWYGSQLKTFPVSVGLRFHSRLQSSIGYTLKNMPECSFWTEFPAMDMSMESLFSRIFCQNRLLHGFSVVAILCSHVTVKQISAPGCLYGSNAYAPMPGWPKLLHKLKIHGLQFVLLQHKPECPCKAPGDQVRSKKMS
jgi:hypothetical protein